jgi:hypothetical protein
MLFGKKKQEPEAAPATPSATPEEKSPLEGVEKLPDGNTRVELLWPIKVGQRDPQTVTHLTIRRPTAADLKKAPRESKHEGAAPYASVEFFAELLMDLPSRAERTAVMDKVDLEDLARIGEVVAGFLPDGLRTGRES